MQSDRDGLVVALCKVAYSLEIQEPMLLLYPSRELGFTAKTLFTQAAIVGQPPGRTPAPLAPVVSIVISKSLGAYFIHRWEVRYPFRRYIILPSREAQDHDSAR
jgi:hypothetical protein